MKKSVATTRPVPSETPTPRKKAYHSPKLRAAGSVRAGTAAAYTVGTAPDGVSSPTVGLQYYS